MQDQQSDRSHQGDRSVHPTVERLRAELDAAHRSIGVLDELEAEGRERVVADLLGSVPDVASRAACAAGADEVVATIHGFVVADESHDGAATALWDRIVRTAVEAAEAAVTVEEPVFAGAARASRTTTRA